MQLARPAFAPHPGGFGRGPLRAVDGGESGSASALGSDLKLFATTFLAGFVVVSVLIA